MDGEDNEAVIDSASRPSMDANQLQEYQQEQQEEEAQEESKHQGVNLQDFVTKVPQTGENGENGEEEGAEIDLHRQHFDHTL